MSKVYYGEDNIKPDFSVSKNSDNDSAVFRNQIAQPSSSSNSAESSQSALQSLENSSAVANSETNSLANLRDLEQKSFYTGSGNFQNQNQLSGKEKAKKLKKYAPLIGLIVLLFGGLFSVIFGISNIANHIETLITRATDTMFGTYSATSLQMTKEYMQKKHGKFPDYLKQRLAKNDIEVQEKSNEYVLIYNNKTITADKLKSVYDSDQKFQLAFTKSKRGRTANFFDPGAAATFSSIKVTRNLFKSFKRTDDKAADEKAFLETDIDQYKGHGAEGRYVTEEEKPETDKDGNTKTVVENEPQSVESKSYNSDTPDVDTDGQKPSSIETEKANLKTANTKAQKFIDGLSVVAGGATIGCGVLRVANMVSLAVAASQIINMVHHFSSTIEPISKSKAGQGNTSPVNEALSRLTTPKKAKYIDTSDGQEKEIEGAPVQAQGAYSVLSGEKAQLSQTKNYAIENVFNAAQFSIATSTTANAGCAVASFAASVVDIASNVAAVVTTPFSAGTSIVAVTVLKKFAAQKLLSTISGFAIKAGLAVLIPYVAKTIFSNPALALQGIPSGESFVGGANIMNGRIGRQAAGQGPASKEIADAYFQETVIAANEEAKLDRMNRSPFDVSSPNTFLGNLVVRFGYMPYNNSPLKNLSNLTTNTSRSISSLANITTTNTFAANGVVSTVYDSNIAGVNFKNQRQDSKICQRLANIGAVCDMYGSDISASDPSLKNLDESDPTYQSIIKKYTAKKDNKIQVIEASLLDNKIRYCDNRESPFGVFDQNIMDDLVQKKENALKNSGILGKIIHQNLFGFIPDLMGLKDGIEKLIAADPDAQAWASGKNCVMGESNPHWKEMRYLQKFVERNRICTQTKCEDNTDSAGNLQDPVLAAATRYRQENPIDNSASGQLARFSGLRKTDAEFVLATIDYYNYLAEHRPPETLADILVKPVKTLISGESLYRSTLATQINHLKQNSDTKSNQEKGTKYVLDYKFRFQTSLI